MLSSFILLALTLAGSLAAPRSKTKSMQPNTVYDQKQTGDYNIQLHLKDFQIIALLADESLGSLGDYDYNYDYSDFTVKPPSTSSTTPKPVNNNETVEIVEKPFTRPKPTTSTSTTTTSTTTVKVPTNSSNSSTPPSNLGSSTHKPVLLESLNKTSTNLTELEELLIGINNQNLSEAVNPGKIKVQIIEAPLPQPQVGIVPGEELTDNSETGDIMQYRKCTQGFTRDKKGRCRRVRRPGAVTPQLPFGISRLASNLAARFRYNPEATSNV